MTNPYSTPRSFGFLAIPTITIALGCQERRARRSAMSSARSLPVVMMAVTLAACVGDDPDPPGLPLPPVIWEGQYLNVASDLPTALCGGTAPHLDSLLGALRERWGTEVEEPSLYYALGGELTEYDTPCVAGQLGCVEGGVVYSGLVPLDHEIVHLAREPIHFSFPLIEEGAAEYWGDDAPLRPDLSGRISELVEEGNPLGFEHYTRAGHFVAYLVESSGEAALEALSSATTLESSPEEFRSAVDMVYGLSLQELEASYEANYPECPQSEYRAAFGECHASDALPICADGSGLLIQRRGSCAEGDVLGPRLDRIWTTIQIEVAVTGSYGLRFSATPGDDVVMSMRSCGGGCPMATFGADSSFPGWRLVELDAGVHVAKIEWAAGTAIDFELEFRECPV